MKLDSFAEIGARRAVARQRLVHPTPLAKPRNVLPLGAPGSDLQWAKFEKLETQEELERELQRQREIHAPFLRRLAPAVASQRQRRDLVHWKWRMETTEDRENFDAVLSGAGAWEEVTLPHYGGPVGRATTFYRTEIEVPRLEDGSDWTLCFEAADYIARVYCNGRCLGEHEGFFAPFEFALSACLVPGAVNTLLVEMHNDAVCRGVALENGTTVDGDKLYAATGPGWDDPALGWHHCPPGMGIFGEVFIESRHASWISHAWVRTLDLEGNIEVFLEISGRDYVNPPVIAEYAIYGENFEQTAQEPTAIPLSHPVGRGPNLYRFTTQIAGPRIWCPESPWLYSLQITLRDGESVVDGRSRTFGLRTFQCDCDSDPKGRFLLNGKELRLMGANTMGFEQQDVMRGDFDQLRDDMLLAKISRMNFLRLTQRPVQDAIYDMCDRLGVMTQSDLPHFAVLRRPQFGEAVRQAAEMERMLCPHPCNIVVSYFNEPFPAEWNVAYSRHLTRPELERFFTAVDQVILSINPDRVLKPVDGDFDPPAPGFPDNHCYTLWYVGNGIDSGALHAGEWMAIKPGWNYGCGEFGAEGLDFVDLMRRRYPHDWLPSPEAEASWDPGQIVNAQSGSHFCFFYDRQKTVEGWVRASQNHQSEATRWMTDAFRRDKRMVSFAIHLFIDAWPAGWMKSIMDCERRAKPAWFAYRDALSPIHISWRADRRTCFAGETVNAEIWVVNDSGSPLNGAEIRYRISDGDRVVTGGRYALPAIECIESLGAGVVPFCMPEVVDRKNFELRACVLDGEGRVLHEAVTSIEVFPKASHETESICVLSGCQPIGLPDYLIPVVVAVDDLQQGKTVVCEGGSALRDLWPALVQKVREGARLIVLNAQSGAWEIADGEKVQIEDCAMGPRHFVSRATGHPLVRSFRPEDFKFWYDDEAGRITPLLNRLIVGREGQSILASGQLAFGQPFGAADAVREYFVGQGSILFSCLELKGRLSNPIATEFLERLIQPCLKEVEESRR